MKLIWKFPLSLTDSVIVKMPKNAKIISLQVQNEIPTIWAIVNDDQEFEERKFNIYPTGSWLDEELKQAYIETIQIRKLVFHVFEEEIA